MNLFTFQSRARLGTLLICNGALYTFQSMGFLILMKKVVCSRGVMWAKYTCFSLPCAAAFLLALLPHKHVEQ